jgi:hypothetical protein
LYVPVEPTEAGGSAWYRREFEMMGENAKGPQEAAAHCGNGHAQASFETGAMKVRGDISRKRKDIIIKVRGVAPELVLAL